MAMTTLAVEKSITFKNILLATDFSEVSRQALTYAAAIARANNAQLFVVHVLPPEPWIPVPLDPTPLSLDPGRRQAKTFLRELAADTTLTGLRHTEIVTRGLLWNALAELIEQEGIDLLVLGTHGRTGIKKLVLGSVAEELFRRAPCPVLTIGPGAKAGEDKIEIRRVLFATDFGPASLNALPYAVDIANVSDGELILLHVVSPISIAEVGPYWYPDIDYKERQAVDEQDALRRLKELIPDSASLKCSVKYVVSNHLLPDAIVGSAMQHAANLIVMGVKGSGAGAARTAAHVPLAVAHDVVCRSKCPVLTVRG
jgi:nucleotide-binding universal stress UspA family protein